MQTQIAFDGATKPKFQSDLIAHLASQMIQELSQPQDAFVGFVGSQPKQDQDICCKYTLTCRRSGDLQCTGLSWNATGAMLCAAFGRSDLTGWCNKSGILCCWSLFRPEFNPECPTCSVEHSSCFTTIACHPSQPSLMAAGSFDGEVLIYDLADSCDVLKACSNISDYSHREPVSSLQWNRNRGAFTASIDAYQLVSLSSDGKILWWSLATIKHATAEISGHLPYPVRGVTLACNPELTLLTNMAASSPIVGGTSMALAESCVMIGSEGGKILRCHPRKKNIKKLFAGSDSNIHWDKSAIDFFDNLPPCITSKLIKHVELWANSVSRQVVSAKDIFVSKPPLRYVFPAPTGVTEYEGHVGPITMISMSPFHRRVFLSVGVDGYAKLWSTMQRRALMTMRDTSCIHLADGLYASGWSKARPLVFAVAGDGGVVRIHDLGNRRPMLPAVELKAPMPASANDTDRRILALQFNHKQRNFLATGNAAGHVHVWRLSWGLSNQSSHEHEKLQSCIEHMEEKGA